MVRDLLALNKSTTTRQLKTLWFYLKFRAILYKSANFNGYFFNSVLKNAGIEDEVI